jgi:hypothetical protein
MMSGHTHLFSASLTPRTITSGIRSSAIFNIVFAGDCIRGKRAIEAGKQSVAYKIFLLLALFAFSAATIVIDYLPHIDTFARPTKIRRDINHLRM